MNKKKKKITPTSQIRKQYTGTSLKGAVAQGDYFFLNQHNFLITTGMTLFFIYLRTELNYLSNDIILCGFVVVVYTLYRWTSQI